jgi:hypothetical protein
METWMAKTHGEIALLRWVVGVALLGVVAVFIRSFFFRGL